MMELAGADPAPGFVKTGVVERVGLPIGLVGLAKGRIRVAVELEAEPPAEANRGEAPT
jgi:hypothetical protein